MPSVCATSTGACATPAAIVGSRPRSSAAVVPALATAATTWSWRPPTRHVAVVTAGRGQARRMNAPRLRGSGHHSAHQAASYSAIVGNHGVAVTATCSLTSNRAVAQCGPPVTTRGETSVPPGGAVASATTPSLMVLVPEDPESRGWSRTRCSGATLRFGPRTAVPLRCWGIWRCPIP
jgi:hypothetical protein